MVVFFFLFTFVFSFVCCCFFFFFSSRRRHTRCLSDWSSDVCSSDLLVAIGGVSCRGSAACWPVQRRCRRRRSAACVGGGRAPPGHQSTNGWVAVRVLWAGVHRGLPGPGDLPGSAAGPGRGPGRRAWADRGGVLRCGAEPGASMVAPPAGGRAAGSDGRPGLRV